MHLNIKSLARSFKLQWAATLIVLAGLSLLQVWVSWSTATNHPWSDLTSYCDSVMLGPIYEKYFDPSLFTRDYMYSDLKTLEVYTPLWSSITRAVPQIFGHNLDYAHVLALMQGPVTFAFLCAAFALFWLISRSWLISLSLALLSMQPVISLWDHWSVNGLDAILPRTLVLPVIVGFTAWLYWCLGRKNGAQPASKWWHWAVSGCLLGIAANIHPPTGIAFAAIVGVMCLASWKRSKNLSIANIVILTVFTMLVALPIVLFVGQTTRAPNASSFEALREFITMLVQPRPYGESPDVMQKVGFIGWVLLSVLSWFLSRTRSRSLPLLIFGFIQLAMVTNVIPTLDLRLILILAAALIWAWWNRKDEAVMIFLEMTAAMLLVSIFGANVLTQLGAPLKSWTMVYTSGQILRVNRLLPLPLAAMGALLASDLLKRDSVSRLELWLITVAAFSLLLPFNGITFAELLIMLILLRWRPKMPRQYDFSYTVWALLIPLLSSFVIIQALFIVLYVRMGASTIAGIGVLSIGLGLLIQPNRTFTRNWKWSKPASYLLMAIGILAILHRLRALTLPRPGLTETTLFVAIGLVGLAVFVLWMLWPRKKDVQTTYLALVIGASSVLVMMHLSSVALSLFGTSVFSTPPPLVQAAFWSRQNTPRDSLFYIAVTNQIVDLHKLDAEFWIDASAAYRYWSERSITHSTKDFNLLLFSTPGDIPAAEVRYDALSNASLNPDSLIQQATTLGADYVLRNTDEPLDLPIVYENTEYTIYRVTAQAQ